MGVRLTVGVRCVRVRRVRVRRVRVRCGCNMFAYMYAYLVLVGYGTPYASCKNRASVLVISNLTFPKFFQKHGNKHV